MKKLNARHHEIMRRVIAGERQQSIADAVGISEQSVSRIVNDPVFKNELEKNQQAMDRGIADVKEDIGRAAGTALDVVMETLEDTNVSRSLRTKIAFFILDAAGCGKKNVMEYESGMFGAKELIIAAYCQSTGESPEKYLPRDQALLLGSGSSD